MATRRHRRQSTPRTCRGPQDRRLPAEAAGRRQRCSIAPSATGWSIEVEPHGPHVFMLNGRRRCSARHSVFRSSWSRARSSGYERVRQLTVSGVQRHRRSDPPVRLRRRVRAAGVSRIRTACHQLAWIPRARHCRGAARIRVVGRRLALEPRRCRSNTPRDQAPDQRTLRFRRDDRDGRCGGPHRTPPTHCCTSASTSAWTEHANYAVWSRHRHSHSIGSGSRHRPVRRARSSIGRSPTLLRDPATHTIDPRHTVATRTAPAFGDQPDLARCCAASTRRCMRW